MADAENYSPQVILAMVVNVVSTVGCVLFNKYLNDGLFFQFMLFLSFIHFSFTALSTRALLCGGFFKYKEASFTAVLPVALGSLGSVAFMNLNLAYNSVGFYQISKLLCIPVTVAIQYYQTGQVVSKRVIITLMVLLLGVGIATVTDLELNQIGLFYAALAIGFTVMGQIFTQSKQKELGLDSMQLLHHASPIIAAGMLIFTPLLDPVWRESSTKPGLLQFLQTSWRWTVPLVGCIAASAVFALAVNVSNYLVIGQTSPITYQVVGHLKTLLILILGFLFFGKEWNPKNVFGISVAVVGMIWYSYEKQRESQLAKHKEPEAVPLTTNK